MYIQIGENIMSSNTTNVSIRMNVKLKEQTEGLFGELALNLSTDFNIFIRQSLPKYME